MKLNDIITLGLLGTIALSSCNDFLDEPTSKTTAIEVTTTEQLDALLGNIGNFYQVSNRTAIYSTDDFELNTELFSARENTFSLAAVQYATWDVEGLQTDAREGFWSGEYKKIFYANMIFDYIDKVSGSDEQKTELIAEAHLIRAYSLMELANTFCLPYTGDNGDELGLPLKQSVSFEELSSRNTLAETYSLIEADLAAAAALTTPLKEGDRIRSWRGNTGAYNAINARYWLLRNDYKQALAFAEAALAEHHELVDYNTEMRYGKEGTYTINGTDPDRKETVTVEFPYTHDNQIDMTDMVGWKEFYYFRLLYHESWWYVPSKQLLALYEENPYDLRYKYHIVEHYSYDRLMTDPAYDYPGYVFFYKDRIPEGPTVAEMYLIKAECLAQNNDVTGAMDALNTLRRARIDQEHYTDVTASTQAEAIRKIRDERRREMPFSRRWEDIRRYNHNEDPSDDVELARLFYPYTTAAVLSGETPIEYKLTKDSRRWATPIPYTELVSSNGEILQNTY